MTARDRALTIIGACLLLSTVALAAPGHSRKFVSASSMLPPPPSPAQLRTMEDRNLTGMRVTVGADPICVVEANGMVTVSKGHTLAGCIRFLINIWPKR